MSDDDPVESFVEGSVEPFGEEEADEYTGPKARDMEAELRARTGSSTGGADDADEAAMEADPETARAFWSAVIYVNAGILLMALGPVVYALRGRALVSVALVAAGVAALVRAYTVYRAFDADDGEDGGDNEAGDASAADDADA
ncbi:DUF7322 domain-containing protein [Halolamina salifodinae]|uniref:DUF7322 domain-containing protein n=1 Tax=Halolamina salifodinae TaxID=1202767 RepID=A0A8T4GRU2_9EURY|nr:hypothetical protein [Halolamina salifodinae]MBP1985559.1 hypothetical protein [Halolamina salifodinae]